MEHTIQREEQIFLGALEFEQESERLAFLERRCGDDAELRQRVEELLSLHGSGNQLLDETSGALFGGDVAKTVGVSEGDQLGPYKLLQEIGHGGMGVVYMAEQLEPVRRRVAVKIIKLGMDTRNVVARFEAERQALALMDHPNITKVLDAGATESGRPFFVMELVTGLPITEYCDREQLTLRQRLELFYQVCVGIKHAHQKGVIHRDLKPSNVMVTHYDGQPVPKIIDFGIAKAIDQPLTEKTLFTSYGNMMGTPEYMSPEQAEMSGQDIDTRADVYSLGVLMYELLTGTTPFYRWKGKGLHKFCEAVCHQEPELASTRVNQLAETVDDISRKRQTDTRNLRKFLKGDLDWILAKCMSKKRSDRYESASDLARDVRRFLEGEPVEAAAPTVTYRAAKFASRHRTPLIVGSLCMLTLIAGTIVSAVFAVKATRAERLAKLRLERVEVLRQQAIDERDRAMEAEARLKQMEEQSRVEAMFAKQLLNTSADARPEFSLEPPKQLYQRQASPAVGESGVVVIESIPGPEERRLQGSASGMRSRNSRRQQDLQVSATVDSEDPRHLKVRVKPWIQVEGDGRQNQIVIRDDAERGTFFLQDDKGGAVRGFLINFDEKIKEELGENSEKRLELLEVIGDLSLKDNDLQQAQYVFETRERLLRNGDQPADVQAKNAIILSSVLYKAGKPEQAHRRLREGVSQLRRMKVIPSELKTVVVDLKNNLSDLNIEVEELHELKGDFLHDHDIQIHRWSHGPHTIQRSTHAEATAPKRQPDREHQK